MSLTGFNFQTLIFAEARIFCIISKHSSCWLRTQDVAIDAGYSSLAKMENSL